LRCHSRSIEANSLMHGLSRNWSRRGRNLLLGWTALCGNRSKHFLNDGSMNHHFEWMLIDWHLKWYASEKEGECMTSECSDVHCEIFDMTDSADLKDEKMESFPKRRKLGLWEMTNEVLRMSREQECVCLTKAEFEAFHPICNSLSRWRRCLEAVPSLQLKAIENGERVMWTVSKCTRMIQTALWDISRSLRNQTVNSAKSESCENIVRVLHFEDVFSRDFILFNS
jgi:hypothetical protein